MLMKNRRIPIPYLIFLVLLFFTSLFMTFWPGFPCRSQAGPDAPEVISYYPYTSFRLIAAGGLILPMIMVILSYLWLFLSVLRIFYRNGTNKVLSLGELFSAPAVVLFCGAATTVASGINGMIVSSDNLPGFFAWMLFGVFLFLFILQAACIWFRGFSEKKV